jgi:hypothetical protein
VLYTKKPLVEIDIKVVSCHTLTSVSDFVGIGAADTMGINGAKIERRATAAKR